MKFMLNQAAIEVTRRCNLKCNHCMRGPSQNIDITENIIDSFLDNDEILSIGELLFSGGEPTINSAMIIYTIDKIINNYLNIYRLSMVTNGIVFDHDLIDAFNRFNNYRNNREKKEVIDSCRGDYSLIGNRILESTDNHVFITFSIDKYHKKIPNSNFKLYKEYGSKLNFLKYTIDDYDIYKTGYSNIGDEYNYSLRELRYYKEPGAYFIVDYLYLCANGLLTSNGMGMYQDMDRINYGFIQDISIENLMCEEGKPIYGRDKIIKKV